MTNELEDLSRRRFLVAATAVTGGALCGAFVVPVIGNWAISEREEAAGAPVKFDVSKLAPGQMAVVEWRKQPIWIVKRDQRMLDGLKKIKDSDLKDPNSEDADQQPAYAKDNYRAQDEEVLVLVGSCTHLGCSPLFKPEPDPKTPLSEGGFFCPCHGSSFDFAGRVYSGSPASKNLLVPAHHFVEQDPTTKKYRYVIVGEDPKEA